jgi:thiol-disulfide isomerase/thioredoxin
VHSGFSHLDQELAAQRTRNLLTAMGSVVSAVAFFFYQHIHPVEAVSLLRKMQSESPQVRTRLTCQGREGGREEGREGEHLDSSAKGMGVPRLTLKLTGAPGVLWCGLLWQLVSVVSNGRPTVVDFYAEWCENCKEMAPLLRELEARYKGQVNFVVVNGDSPQAADLVETFRVDGIPHLALISKEGEVKTALIGKVPRPVLEADINSLIADQELPYEGYDAFEDESHFLKLDK